MTLVPSVAWIPPTLNQLPTMIELSAPAVAVGWMELGKTVGLHPQERCREYLLVQSPQFSAS